MAAGDSNASSAAERAIAVLEVVGREGPGVTAKTIAASLAMSPAAAYRLLNSLVATAYLVRLPDLSGFALGRGSVELATAISPPLICAAARRIMDDLRSEIRFGVHLVTFGSAMRLADTDPDNPIRDIVSFVRQPTTSAAGKLFLNREQSAKRTTQAPLRAEPQPPNAANTKTNQPGQVAREQGGLRPDISSVAIAVLHSERQNVTVGALMLTGPTTRAQLLETFIPTLQSATLRLQPLLS